MADQVATEDLGEDFEVEAKPRSGMSGRTLVLFIILPILLVLGGAAGAYLTGALDPLLGAAEEQVVEAPPVEEVSPSVFYDLPEMLVNLNASGRKASYLKISVSLELAGSGALDQIELVVPRIVHNFQVYLRDLGVEDLQGSARLQRLREELLLRVNTAARPAVVKNVLFKEILIQ